MNVNPPHPTRKAARKSKGVDAELAEEGAESSSRLESGAKAEQQRPPPAEIRLGASRGSCRWERACSNLASAHRPHPCCKAGLFAGGGGRVGDPPLSLMRFKFWWPFFLHLSPACPAHLFPRANVRTIRAELRPEETAQDSFAGFFSLSFFFFGWGWLILEGFSVPFEALQIKDTDL